MCEESGDRKELRIHTDASACKAMFSRRGLGKTRHISRWYLSVQQRCKAVNPKGDFSIHKVGTKQYCAGLGTKTLDKASMTRLAELSALETWSISHEMALVA